MIGVQTGCGHRIRKGTAHTVRPERVTHGMSCFCFF